MELAGVSYSIHSRGWLVRDTIDGHFTDHVRRPLCLDPGDQSM
jgi:hypothetical protein